MDPFELSTVKNYINRCSAAIGLNALRSNISGFYMVVLYIETPESGQAVCSNTQGNNLNRMLP